MEKCKDVVALLVWIHITFIIHESEKQQFVSSWSIGEWITWTLLTRSTDKNNKLDK